MRGALGGLVHRNTAKKYMSTPQHRKKIQGNTVTTFFQEEHDKTFLLNLKIATLQKIFASPFLFPFFGLDTKI